MILAHQLHNLSLYSELLDSSICNFQNICPVAYRFAPEGNGVFNVSAFIKLWAGLVICKIIENHGGEIWPESEMGVRTRFRISS